LTHASTGEQPLRSGYILAFWLPLAATWLMMAAEGPTIAAIIARQGESTYNLAAFGVAFSLAWLVESPIMMLLTASNALVADRPSFLALRRFTLVLNTCVTALLLLVALPPVFEFVTGRLMGLPPEVRRLTHLAVCVLIPWPAAIGYRRFYQGILVRHHLTRRVAYGTIVRLSCMSLVALGLALGTRLPGALIGALALASGVVAEAAASRVMARHLVRTLLDTPGDATPTFQAIGRFYFPLALTSMISTAMGPLVTFFLGHSRLGLQSLAVWPVVASFSFLFRSGGIAYQEVGVVLCRAHAAAVRRAAWRLASGTTLLLAIILLTPLGGLWFTHVVGLSADLADLATGASRILLCLPALEYLLSYQRSCLIVAGQTRTVTWATLLEALALAAILLVTVGVFQLVGATAAALALLLGRLTSNGFLLLRKAEAIC
jgi:progressive ankylosis protein